MNDILFSILFFITPWAIGVSCILDFLIKLYWNCLWKGMKEEKRYEYIKVSKW